MALAIIVRARSASIHSPILTHFPSSRSLSDIPQMNRFRRSRLDRSGFGGKLVSHSRYVVFQIAEVAIPGTLFTEILRLIAELPCSKAIQYRWAHRARADIETRQPLSAHAIRSGCQGYFDATAQMAEV